jgi:hypothetical protein
MQTPSDAKPNLMRPSAYAKSRSLNPSTVSRQIRDGKIPTRDGMIDAVEADRARQRNLQPIRAAEAARRKAKVRSGVSSAFALAETPSDRKAFAAGQRDIIGRVLDGFAGLPAALHRLGAPPAVALASSDVFDAVLWQALSDDLVLSLFGWDGPPPLVKLSNESLCALLGFGYDESKETAAEAFLERALIEFGITGKGEAA